MAYKTPNMEDIINAARTTAYVYKHSPACPLCVAAKVSIDKFADLHDVFLITIPDDRKISDEFAEFFHVKHKTPQFIELKDSKPVKVLNHFDLIKADL